MGFFLGWLIVALDNHGPRSDDEAAAFACMSASILGILFYIFSIALRLNWGIVIHLASEGWYLLGMVILSVFLWFSVFAFCKSL